MRSIVSLACMISLIAASPALAQSWSSQPWLDDLAQVRQAFRTKYANIDWLVHDRGVSLDTLFDRAAMRIQKAGSDAAARVIFERLVQRIGDGHVSVDWPQPAVTPSRETAAPQAPPDTCQDLGFDVGRAMPGIGLHLRGYTAVGGGNPFSAGTLRVGMRTIGVLRIGGFEPQGSPALCRVALRALSIPADKPCNDQCQDRIFTWTYDRLTADLADQIGALRAAGATVLLVDITGNGGGTEWAEAAARMVSPKPITSERRGYVRGAHWADQWRALTGHLRAAADRANAVDRPRLLSWATQAAASEKDAERSCASDGSCALVGRGGYATGLVGTAPAGAFAGKPWADLVFSIAQYPYRDSVWSGPLAVLVDGETWSAAEEFAAVLQDNRAAVIIGDRTGGAGCGHTKGGTPTVLTNSGATLELPDCVRFRADGSNEVAGVIPDILLGVRPNDGVAFKTGRIEARLPDMVQLAIKQRTR